jgi:tripartite-type tricarboxylate transporter receptor subunit TctC
MTGMPGSRTTRVAPAILAFLGGLAAGTGPDDARSQPYPQRPVRMVVPYPAGGPASVVAHVVGERLGERLGQTVVVDPRPGASANIGTDIVAKSAPDGHTLLMGANGPLVINAALFRKLPFDAERDFAAIVHVGILPLLLVVPPSLPARSVKELVALAQAQPGKLTYASSGTGTGGHLSGALLSTMAKIDIVHVPYKGAAPATTDLIGGHVSMMFDGIIAALPHVRSGRLRTLGVAMPRRATMAPDIPTIAETALPGFEITSWFGVVAPAGTPRPIVERLNRDIGTVLRLPDVHERLSVQGGFELVGGTPEAFDRTMRNERVLYAKIVRDANARLD